MNKIIINIYSYLKTTSCKKKLLAVYSPFLKSAASKLLVSISLIPHGNPKDVLVRGQEKILDSHLNWTSYLLIPF